MTKDRNIQIVQQVYTDFSNGNIDGVLNALTNDVSWSDPGYPDIPYAAKRTGKEEVTEFFKALNTSISLTQFTPQEFYGDNGAVVVKGFFSGEANTTKKTFESDWVMIWKLQDEKIYSYQAFVDTKLVSEAFK